MRYSRAFTILFLCFWMTIPALAQPPAEATGSITIVDRLFEVVVGWIEEISPPNTRQAPRADDEDNPILGEDGWGLEHEPNG